VFLKDAEKKPVFKKMKNPLISSGFELATFQLVLQPYMLPLKGDIKRMQTF
jgi:hypothetical protein